MAGTRSLETVAQDYPLMGATTEAPPSPGFLLSVRFGGENPSILQVSVQGDTSQTRGSRRQN
jgi:hypothetical protein